MCLRNELRSALRRLLVTGMLPLAAGAASAMQDGSRLSSVDQLRRLTLRGTHPVSDCDSHPAPAP